MVMQEEDLINTIKRNKIFNFYFFYGDENFLIDEYVKDIVQLVVQKKANQFNYKRCYFEDFSFDDFKLFLSLSPLCANRKIFILQDIDMKKLNTSFIAKIAEIIKYMDKRYVVIIVARGKPYDIQKTVSFKNFLKNDQIICVKITLKNESWLVDRFSKYLKENGFFMSHENLIFFIRQCNNNMLLIYNELQKLFSFVEKGEISKDQILTLTKTQVESNAFLIVENLLEGKKETALKIFNEVTRLDANILQLFGAISYYFLDLYRMKVAKSIGKVKFNEILKYYNYYSKEFRIKKAYFKSDLYSIERLRRYVILISI